MTDQNHVHEFGEINQMGIAWCECGASKNDEGIVSETIIGSIRDTAAYKELDNYLAVGRAEGFEPAETEEQVIAAWQYIKDKGLWRGLQGFFGRTVANLTEEGILI